MGTAIHPIGAYVQGPNPIQDIINGMVQGVELHNQIQRTQDEHAAMQRVALEQARNNRIQDITQKMLLQANSREIGPDGTVTQQGDPLTVTLPGGVTSSTPVSYTRKADKSRTVSYRDQDGNEMQRELLTPMEQIQRQVTNDQAIARSQGKIFDVDPNSPIGQMLGVTSPTTLPTTAVPQIYRQIVSGENNERTNKTREDVAETNAGARRDVAQTNADARGAVKLTKTYANDQNQMVGVYSDGTTKVLGPALKKPAGRGGASLTPNAQAVQNRFDQKQQQADQAAVDKLQQQEQTLHAQRKTLGDGIAAKDGDTIPDPLNPKAKVTVNPVYRALWKTRLDEATKKVAGLQQTQTALINKHGGSAGGTGGVAATAAQAIPDTAVKRLKAGTITTFGNGQSWTLGPDGKPQQVQAQGK